MVYGRQWWAEGQGPCLMETIDGLVKNQYDHLGCMVPLGLMMHVRTRIVCCHFTANALTSMQRALKRHALSEEHNPPS